MADIKVTVEPPLENQIVEVTYDGQEIIQPPLTQAENLMRQVSNFILINFEILTFLILSQVIQNFFELQV